MIRINQALNIFIARWVTKMIISRQIEIYSLKIKQGLILIRELFGVYWVVFQMINNNLLKFRFMVAGKYALCLVMLILLAQNCFAEDSGRLLANHGGGGGIRTKTTYIPGTGCTLRYTQDSNDNINFYRCNINFNTHTDWATCIQLCCGTSTSSKYPTPSEDAIDQCEGQDGDDDDDDESSGSTMAIVGGIVAAIAFVVIGVLVIRCVCRKRKSRTSPISEEIIIDEKSNNWSNEKVNSRPDRDIVWSSNARNSRHLKISYQPCTICLEENTNTELCCSHQFHPKCIGTWLKKSNVCPCCRFEGVKEVKIFCGMCRWRYYVCSRSLAASKSDSLPMKCENCMDLCDPLEDNTICEIKSSSEGSDKMIELMNKTRTRKLRR